MIALIKIVHPVFSVYSEYMEMLLPRNGSVPYFVSKDAYLLGRNAP